MFAAESDEAESDKVVSVKVEPGKERREEGCDNANDRPLQGDGKR